MRLLLTNDDGVGSEGLTVLAERLSKEHEVWIIAPDTNRSGVSHGITMSDSLKLTEIGYREYKYSGTPADCVIVGIRGGVLPGLPDVIISGINKGANIGTDILYSGTVAGARQAVIYGVPGIALSVEAHDNRWHYGALADFTAKNLEQLVKMCALAEKDGGMPESPCVFVNVNAKSSCTYKGVKCTDISFRKYCDSVALYSAPDKNRYSFFCGGEIITGSRNSSDYDAVQKGYISVSRVYAEPVSAGTVDGIVFSL